MVFLVGLEMLVKIPYSFGQHSNLNLGRADVIFILAEGGHDFSLLLC